MVVVVWLQGVTSQRGGERYSVSRSCLLVRSGRENANNRKMGVGQSQVDLTGEGGGLGSRRDERGLVVEGRKEVGSVKRKDR